MPNLTENPIEQFTIKLLQRLGYQYIYGPDIAPDSEKEVSLPSGKTEERVIQ